MAKYSILIPGKIPNSFLMSTLSTFAFLVITNFEGVHTQSVTIQTTPFGYTDQGNGNTSNITNNLENPTLNHGCPNGNGFTTLETCIEACKEKLNVNRAVNFQEENISEDPIKFKSVELINGEFFIRPDGILKTNRLPISDFTKNLYILVNRTVTICYPLQPNCDPWYLDLPDDEFELSEDMLKLTAILPEGKSNTRNVDQFFLQYENGSISSAAECRQHEPVAKEVVAVNTLMVIAYFVSAISLTSAFFMCIFIPQLNMKKNIVLLCHMFMLATAYWVLVVNSLVGYIDTEGCMILSFLRQYTFLSSFLWVNVQSVDLYIRFVTLGAQASEKRRFIFFAIYAWGIPLLICSVTLIVAKTEVPSDPKSLMWHPNFRRHCWFNPDHKFAAFVYFYSVIIFVLASNIALFGLIIYKLHSLGQSAKSVNKNIFQQLLQLYSKLFVVMGLFWIMEVISWAVGGDPRNWYFTDLINSSQGLIIFIIYICKPRFFRRLLPKNRPSWWPWKKTIQTLSSKDNLTEGTSKFTTNSNSGGTEQSIALHTLEREPH